MLRIILVYFQNSTTADRVPGSLYRGKRSRYELCFISTLTDAYIDLTRGSASSFSRIPLSKYLRKRTIECKGYMVKTFFQILCDIFRFRHHSAMIRSVVGQLTAAASTTCPPCNAAILTSLVDCSHQSYILLRIYSLKIMYELLDGI